MDNILQLRHGDDDAVKIGELYAKARSSVADSISFLIEAGQRLAKKKEEVGHGNWMRWLEANADVLEMDITCTPQRLMKAASKFGVNAEYDEKEALAISQEIWGNESRGIKPYSGDDEWYTPAKYIERVRRVLGGIDLDPASNKRAQRIVKAKRYFTKADDALTKDWCGRVWLNPPYSKRLLLKFVSKLIHEFKVKNTTAAVMLLNNFTDAGWFQLACSACAAVCFPRGRISFTNAVTDKIDRPLNGQVFFYYGDDVESFRSEFAGVGCGFIGVGSWPFDDPDDHWMRP
jgi:phage N-6-adenine-methyltransferase